MPEHTVAHRDSGEMLQNAVSNITRAGSRIFFPKWLRRRLNDSPRADCRGRPPMQSRHHLTPRRFAGKPPPGRPVLARSTMPRH